MSIKKSFDATGGTKSVEYKLLESVCKNISIKVKSSDDWIKAVTKESEGKKTIEITVSKNEDDDPRNGTVTPSVNDKECSLHVITIEQAGGSPEPPEPGEKLCWRGTDNGTDYYADESDPTKIKKVSNPILLCGCAGDNKGDSIFVSEGLDYSKTGEEGTWNPLTTEGFTVGDGNWCKVQLTTTPLCCGQPSFNVSVLSDFEGTETEHVRSVTFYFKAHTYPPDGKVPACAGDGNPCTYEGAGKELCESWEYEVRQCALGYCWCGEHSKDAEAKPCGECTNKYRDCTDPYYCGTTPPGECTITGGKTVPGYNFPQGGNTIVGTYSNCSGNLTATHKSGSGEHFLDSFVFDKGNIKAVVSKPYAECETGKTRESTYIIKDGTTELGELKVTQKAFIDSVSIDGKSVSDGLEIVFKTDGTIEKNYAYSPDYVPVEFDEVPEWVTSLVGDRGIITGSCQSTTASRQENVIAKFGGSAAICPNQIKVTIKQSIQGDVFSINGHTSSFGDNAVKEAMEYNINNSKPAHFKISAIGGNPICKINGLIEGDIEIEGINKITWSLEDVTRDTTNYIDFEDLENPSNKLSLTLWIRY